MVWVISFAISCLCSTELAEREDIELRAIEGVSRHAGNALFAASTATSISFAPP